MHNTGKIIHHGFLPDVVQYWIEQYWKIQLIAARAQICILSKIFFRCISCYIINFKIVI